MADRMGRMDAAIQSLEHAYGPWRQHAAHGLRTGAVMFLTCVPKVWPRVSEVWTLCVPSATRIGLASVRSSREAVPQYIFRVLVEAGRRQQAIGLARARGWLRDQGDYCRPGDLPVSCETAALLAMLLEPDRADCVALLGERIADEGLARLGRLMLRDRAERSRRPEVRAQAEWVLRYRPPDHEVPKLAESLNVTGWQLQHRHNRPAEALAAYTKAIAADPMFSWPYNNIGRVHLGLDDAAQALTWFTKAVEVNPSHLRARSNQGLAAAQLGRYDEALAAYCRVLAMNPTDAHAHASVGWLHLNAGRRTEGLRELQAALRLAPGLDDARRVLDAQYGRDARRGPTPFSAQ
jgi:tetratricopeptide (TPR) repeat protein